RNDRRSMKSSVNCWHYREMLGRAPQLYARLEMRTMGICPPPGPAAVDQVWTLPRQDSDRLAGPACKLRWGGRFRDGPSAAVRPRGAEVRSISNTRPLAAPRHTAASCHNRTHAVQQNRPYYLVGGASIWAS